MSIESQSKKIGFQYSFIGDKSNIVQVENVYSQDGKTNFFEYDFKNNLLTLKKRFAIDYQNVLDWNETVPLQSEELEFVEQTTYDALNRPITITQPDTTVASYVYNKGGLLEQVLHDATTYISNIDYNEKGQRSKISYGNNTQTLYTYNPMNFRLTNIYTKRNSDSNALQDLNFTFDAVGNIVEQTDNAQQTYYYSNQVIAPNAKYTYDPLYRLINATGRELTSLTAPTPNDFTNSIGVPNTAANAMQTYNHTYEFDELGNMQSDNWKDYVYDTDTNRLLKHDPNQTLNDYTYDAHGNMLTMPHLTSMVWDYADRLQSAGNGTFTSYYNYDLGGNRSRKVVVKSNIREERYYLGDYEIYRKYVNDIKTLERSTVHIIDDRDRFAMIETETGNNPIVRYQYNNHLGSACLELDTTAAIISYEEYHPYGTTSYRSGRTETEVNLKRYKYVGKERDEETGLYYYGARYYAAWLCRFVSVDPLAENYPKMSPYMYCAGNPIMLVDPDGRSTNPIYDYEGNFLGPDDWGMQGDAIVMNKSDYTPGMSHENAVTKGRYLDNLPKCMSSAAMNELKANINFHFSTIPSRPDYDGFITIDEGVAWAKEHPGAKYNPTAENTLYADAYFLDFGDLSVSDFNGEEGLATPQNLFTTSNFAKSAYNSKLRSTVYALGRVNMILLNSEVGSVKIVNDDATMYDWNTGGGFVRTSFINSERKRTGLSDEHGFKVYYYGKGFLNK